MRTPGRTSATVVSSERRPSSMSCMIIVVVHTLEMDPIWNSEPTVARTLVSAFSTPCAAAATSCPSAHTPSAAPGTPSSAARSCSRVAQRSSRSAVVINRTLADVRRWPAGARLVGPAGTGAALALVHRLHPGDRDRVPLRDQLGAELLLGQA